MKEQVSVLMDGELFEDEADNVYKELKQDASAQRDWEVYHLIGDVLRQPDYIHSGIRAKVSDRLQTEAVLMVTKRGGSSNKYRTWAVSAAAAVSAVTVVAWMGLKVNADNNAVQTAEMRPASLQLHPDTNEYVMAHQEFSPGTDMNGVASYIRTVTYSANEK